MKHSIGWTLLLYCIPIFMWAQSFDASAYNTERLRLNEVGMSILGSWAIGNMAFSSLSLKGASPEVKAFHQMNIGWNAVNLTISGFGYYAALHDPVDLSIVESIKAGEQMKHILLFNAGLDVGYILGGLYLIERAKNTPNRQDQLRGFGKGVVMNGAFLLVFDSIMVWLHHQHLNKEVYDVINHVALSPGRISLSFAL